MNRHAENTRAAAGVCGLVLIAAMAVANCGDDDSTGPPEISVVAVELTSPIDTIMAAGRSVQLDAVAKDSRGETVAGTSLTWSSSDEDVATVNGSGLVQAVAPGTTTISASTADATGTLRMRVVAADLAAIAALLADPYLAALVDGLGEAPRERVRAAIANCENASDPGHVIAMSDCLTRIAAEAAAVTGATDRVLAAALGFFARHGQLLLSL